VFSNISEEYVRKKEAQRELKRVKHLTAKQAARKKDNEMWEKNRMIRSGTVHFSFKGSVRRDGYFSLEQGRLKI
jgi:hypothetical protein